MRSKLVLSELGFIALCTHPSPWLEYAILLGILICLKSDRIWLKILNLFFLSFHPPDEKLDKAPSSVPTNSRPRPVHITDGVDATRGGRTGGLGRDAGGQDGDNAEDVEHPELHYVLPDRALSRHWGGDVRNWEGEVSAPVSGEPDPPTPGLRGQPPSDQPQSGLLFYLPGLTGLCKADQDLEE